MTAAVALAGATESDAVPSFPAAALVAKLLEACAAGAAVGSAIDLGVVARIEAGPVAPDRVAADSGLTEQGAESLLAALAALGLVARGDDGRFRPAFSRLTAFAELLQPWGSLPLALPGEWWAADAAITAGAERLYPNVVGQLALLFREGANRQPSSYRARTLGCSTSAPAPPPGASRSRPATPTAR